MKVAGSAVLHATPERVWDALLDPAVLNRVIPGCQDLMSLGENHFGMTVTLGVASIRGSYSGEVRLTDLVAPTALVLHAVGAGGPGTIDTTVQVGLADGGDGTTTLTYDADAVVGGMVGGVGQRVLVSVARRTAGLFFVAIDGVLAADRELVTAAAVAEPAAIAESAAAVASGAPVSTAAPVTASAPDPRPVPTTRPGDPAPAPLRSPELLPLAGAALLGAVTTALGVLIGARIGRRSRSPH
ncbi:carbon monoxide dehydrogenase subunit G [Nakamurella flavida]|uniref:Carbon monoxide dehydrogenase subunit G n=1 Tax=Nakamurella flavida TaxID=363630 RepID=A0A939C2M0_9ACTN|nr:carbon monoxide dehydrogenase subunit G [Nakamurella flavida]MBM9476715.1 carbon monoxide dehydrogenase subunit G [Nakamurella flavida]MDP9778847.1 carbon monoxide dehydrogenase subunit G [Nakamurella flavida]